jgi:sulfide dehydrogenase cytochrome subunit
MRPGTALAFFMAVFACAPVSAEPTLQELIAECESCHGPGGVSTQEDVPSLAGKSPAYLREVLEQFRFNERHCPTTTYRSGDRPKTPTNMCSIADSLGEDDREALVSYFAGM